MHRPTIAVIAVVLLLVGLYPGDSGDESISGACLRMGAVMALLWLAQPQLRDVSRWLIATVAIGAFIAMRMGPKLILFALPFLFVMWMLRPRMTRSRADERNGRA